MTLLEFSDEDFNSNNEITKVITIFSEFPD